MKRVIVQHATTGKFLHDGGTWTDVCIEAKEFRSSLDAMSFCQQNGINEVQVRLTFGNPEVDIVLPLSIEIRPPDNRT